MTDRKEKRAAKGKAIVPGHREKVTRRNVFAQAAIQMRYSKARLNQLIRKIRRFLDREFAAQYPDSEIRVSPGYADNVHILIVSESFRERPFTERDEVVWPILEAGLTPEEFVHISVCLLLAPDEAPATFTG